LVCWFLAQPTKQRHTCSSSKAKDANPISSVCNNVVLASINEDGKSLLFFFISEYLTSLSATPKRQRGWRAQQLRAVSAATATTTVPTAITTTTALASPITATPVIAAAPTIIPTASNIVDEDDPFIESSLSKSVTEQPLQLEVQLRALSIQSSQSPPTSDYNTNDASPAVMIVNQKGHKDAQDMKEFFLKKNERWYCKFCKYMFFFITLFHF
jgi:hypothetical protein